jgi:hypothetical protein
MYREECSQESKVGTKSPDFGNQGTFSLSVNTVAADRGRRGENQIALANRTGRIRKKKEKEEKEKEENTERGMVAQLVIPALGKLGKKGQPGLHSKNLSQKNRKSRVVE